jgi:hypothetical protein
MLLSIIFCLFITARSTSLYPEQIRIAWTEKENQMSVQFVTQLPFTTKLAYKEICNSNTSDWVLVYGTSKVIDVGRLTFRPQTLHQVLVDDLKKDCLYRYQVASGIFWSDEFSFKGKTPTRFPTEENLGPANYLIIGDLGHGKNAIKTTDQLDKVMHKENFDALFHLGDIAYDLWNKEGYYSDRFFNLIEPFASEFPYMVMPGNHEGHKNFTSYKDKFRMPHNEANEGTGYFYSIEYGAAHFVALNSELFTSHTKIAERQTQINWLREDLEKANANRSVRPWIFVMLHRPMYCSVDYTVSMKGQDECTIDNIIIQGFIEDIIVQNKVDIVFQAHLHNYERLTPILYNKTMSSSEDTLNYYKNPSAPVYLVVGNAGNYEGTNDPISMHPQDYSVYRTTEFGYGIFKVFNATHLHWSLYGSKHGEMLDYVWIEKDS